MRTICFQFQPDRAPKVSVEQLSALMLRIALAEEGIREFTVQRNGSGKYINYLFVGPSVDGIWNALRERALHHGANGVRHLIIYSLHSLLSS